MRRNRNDNTKKERIIMIASSAFVLTALTMTGIYMQSRDQESENDGYTIDFTAFEDNVDDMYQEIAQNIGPEEGMIDNQAGSENFGLEDDLDYMPLEAGSSQVEIPGRTDKEVQDTAEIPKKDVTQALSVNEAETSVKPEDMDPVEPQDEQQDSQQEQAGEPQEQTIALDGAVVSRELHFSESKGLNRPLSGETVIPFSSKSSVYFTTLDLYKWSRAIAISAPEGTAVAACAEGRVINIYEDAEIGHALTMELGDGYQITYGQLRDVQVSLGSYVNAGDIIGSVAKPTKYYVREGSNLYLQLTANGAPVDPEPLFK